MHVDNHRVCFVVRLQQVVVGQKPSSLPAALELYCNNVQVIDRRHRVCALHWISIDPNLSLAPTYTYAYNIQPDES